MLPPYSAAIMVVQVESQATSCQLRAPGAGGGAKEPRQSTKKKTNPPLAAAISLVPSADEAMPIHPRSLSRAIQVTPLSSEVHMRSKSVAASFVPSLDDAMRSHE